jgi:hypothetical protein
VAGEERKMLLDTQDWRSSSNLCVIFPSEKLIWRLSPGARQEIYSLLGRIPRNYSQHQAFRFAPGSFEEKFKHSGLSATKIEKLKSLAYTNSGSLCFADLYTARSYLDASEFVRFVETLTSVPAYVLRLRLDSTANVDEIIRYWGRGGREKLVTPIVNALAATPGGGAMNISYLLPSFPRLHLYTCPAASPEENSQKEDAVFGALNFFNEAADKRLSEQTEQARVMNFEYEPVRDEPRLGDLVNLVNEHHEVFHTGVYVTDGFVFTKIGIRATDPWIIMKLADLVAMHDSVENPKRVVYLRKKEKAVAKN